jgi:hypothetical protein
MASLQTLFRTVVMLATLGIVAKAWYLYGPTIDEMQTIGSRLSEVAQQAWAEYWQASPTDSSLANDPRLPPGDAAPAPFVPSNSVIEPMPHVPPAVPSGGQGTVQLAGGVPAEIVPVAPSSPWPRGAAPEPVRLPVDTASAPIHTAPFQPLLDRLTQSGVRDHQLEPWGSRGELVRFSCSVPWANSPAYSRHFEAVAASPQEAIERVAAEIEAWRGGQ